MNEKTALKFPCEFLVKVMGANTVDFEAEIVMISRQHIPDLGEASIQSRPSTAGNYVSITITFTATSKPQIDNLYRALTAHPDVKFVL